MNNKRSMIKRIALLCLPLVLLVGCASDGGTRIDNVPMYGQPAVVRPAILKQADQAFIATAVKGFGSREKASQAWWRQGERYMDAGNLDYAMRRYNQSWLLNPENYQPYWGFARVSMEQGKIDEAIGFIEKSESLIDDPYQKVALLADMGSVYTAKGREDRSYYAKANRKFTQSTRLESTYANAWRRWAYSLYAQGRYKEAWQKVDRAEALNARFTREFLEELSKRHPRP